MERSAYWVCWSAAAVADPSTPGRDVALPVQPELSEWAGPLAEPDVPDHAPRAEPARPAFPEQLPYEGARAYAWVPQPVRSVLKALLAPEAPAVPAAEPLVPVRPEPPVSAQSAIPQSTAVARPALAAGSVPMPAEDAVPAAAPASLLPEGGPEPLLPRAFLLSSRLLVVSVQAPLVSPPLTACSAAASRHAHSPRIRDPSANRAIPRWSPMNSPASFLPAKLLPKIRGATAQPHLHQRNSSESSRLFPALSVCRE